MNWLIDFRVNFNSLSAEMYNNCSDLVNKDIMIALENVVEISYTLDEDLEGNEDIFNEKHYKGYL